MFTSQMIVNGTVKPKEIVQTFGVPMVTVKRYVKVYRDRGTKGFYESTPRHSSASVLKGEVLERAQQLLDEGWSIPEVAKQLDVLANTLHKAIRFGRLRRFVHRSSDPRKSNPPSKPTQSQPVSPPGPTHGRQRHRSVLTSTGCWFR